MSEAPPLRITMVRCSTVLLEWGDLALLTDPWFGMHLRGLPCFRRPGRTPEALPPLAAVLVSHLHPDHFDLRAIARLVPPPPRVVLPPGGRAALGGSAPPGSEELTPWQSTTIGAVEVTAMPGPHTGPRPDEVNFVLRFPGWGTLFFGGDARLDRPLVAEIGRTFGPFRVALLPVGGSRILGVRTVMAPDDALAAADLLGAAHVVPLHEGGIWMSVPPLSLHPGRARHLAAAFAARGQAGRITVLVEGASATFG